MNSIARKITRYKGFERALTHAAALNLLKSERNAVANAVGYGTTNNGARDRFLLFFSFFFFKGNVFSEGEKHSDNYCRRLVLRSQGPTFIMGLNRGAKIHRDSRIGEVSTTTTTTRQTGGVATKAEKEGGEGGRRKSKTREK